MYFKKVFYTELYLLYCIILYLDQNLKSYLILQTELKKVESLHKVIFVNKVYRNNAQPLSTI